MWGHPCSAFCTLVHCLRVHGEHLCMWITLLLLILLLLYFHRVMNSSETLFIPKIQSANMISLLPFSPHTTSFIPVRTQHIHMMFHLPFLFTLLFLETAEIYRLWMCIFSTLTSRFFFVSPACVNLSFPQFHFVYCAVFGLWKWLVTACQDLIWYHVLKGCSFIIFH